MLENASAQEAEMLMRSLAADDRAGVVRLVEKTQRRLEHARAEAERLRGLYAFDAGCAENDEGVILGLDEVGRGPVAGPLAVGGVVLDASCPIEGLNDSKLVAPEAREKIADEIKRSCIAWTVCYIEPDEIDERGMSASLRRAFSKAIEDIEAQVSKIDVILLDGNPLRLDPREKSIVKGDRTSASIAAASIVAKVERDALMDDLDVRYPGYGFASHKGYGTKDHIEAIRSRGLSPVHRKTFCTGFMQEALF